MGRAEQQADTPSASEERFRTIVESAPAMLFEADSDAMLVYANQRLLDFMGEDFEAVRGLRWLDRGVHPDDKERMRTEVQDLAERAEPYLVEHRHRRFDGEYRRLLAAGNPRFTSGGEFTGFVGTCVDVTELRLAEDRLRRTERLASIGTLAAGIGHELNNPLAAVMAASDLALQSLGDPRKREVVRRNLDTVVRASRRAARITADLLRFARSDPARPFPERLDTLVRGALDLVRPLAERTGAKLDIAPLPAVELQVRGLDLQHAIANVARNGLLSANRAVHLRVDAERSGDRISIRVTDDGEGIPPDDLDHIFDPFFTTRRETGGTGLGLSLVHRIIEDHGGRIEVESELGKGTTFQIVLPVLAG